MSFVILLLVTLEIHPVQSLSEQRFPALLEQRVPPISHTRVQPTNRINTS